MKSEEYISIAEAEKLVDRKVRQVLAEMLGVAQTTNNFLTATRAIHALGYQHIQQLYEAVDSGLFRVGIEVQDRRKPGAKYARYYFDIQACLNRLSELPDRR